MGSASVTVRSAGAAALAALGAARAGAGLVTIACPAGLNDVLELLCTEAMTAPVPDTAQRAFAASAAEAVLALAATREAVGLGPGIGRSAETLAFVSALAKRLERPLVLDADALFAFAGAPEPLASRRAATVLTPHPGEAAVLLGMLTGYLAQGCDAFTAAALAAFVHGAAADHIAQRTGPSGLLASDLAGELPETAQRLRQAAAAPVGATGLALDFPEP